MKIRFSNAFQTSSSTAALVRLAEPAHSLAERLVVERRLAPDRQHGEAGRADARRRAGTGQEERFSGLVAPKITIVQCSACDMLGYLLPYSRAGAAAYASKACIGAGAGAGRAGVVTCLSPHDRRTRSAAQHLGAERSPAANGAASGRGADHRRRHVSSIPRPSAAFPRIGDVTLSADSLDPESVHRELLSHEEPRCRAATTRRSDAGRAGNLRRRIS